MPPPAAAGTGLPLDEGESARLRRDAESLGLQLPDAAIERLLGYLALLQRWNAAYNLTAVREPSKMRVQHLADCLALVSPLRRELARLGRREGSRILDVGSGGGLPGAVLAIVEQQWDVHCVDSVGKKVAFVRQVAGELGLGRLHAVHARVEALRVPAFDVITSRAFASLAAFVKPTRALLADSGIWVAMKGRRPDEEMAALPADIEVFHVEPLAVPGLDGERCLVWMRRR